MRPLPVGDSPPSIRLEAKKAVAHARPESAGAVDVDRVRLHAGRKAGRIATALHRRRLAHDEWRAADDEDPACAVRRDRMHVDRYRRRRRQSGHSTARVDSAQPPAPRTGPDTATRVGIHRIDVPRAETFGNAQRAHDGGPDAIETVGGGKPDAPFAIEKK